MRQILLLATAALSLSVPASAQLLPGGGGGLGGALERDVGGLMSGLNDPFLGSVVDRSRGSIAGADELARERLGDVVVRAGGTAASLLDLRHARLDGLIRGNSAILEADENGNPVRRGILLAIDPDQASLSAAARAGFHVAAIEQIDALGVTSVKLSVPAGMKVREARRRLAKAAPSMVVDYDHVYEPAGGSLAPVAGVAMAGGAPFRAGTRIAMIDGGVGSHPSFKSASIEQRGFAGSAQPTGHGTAVASLLVGQQGPFSGAARGAQLFVADVYGGSPAAGSASVILKALGWAAAKRPAVINISLVGPANRAMERAVSILRGRGIQLVAAVGNDGPAAPAQYPASYDGVLAVTGVDGSGKSLREAGRARHLDIAAPGADMAAALPGKGFARVRGTSFAAPLAAARLAASGSPGALFAEARPGKGKVGRGIVCATCAVRPATVGAK